MQKGQVHFGPVDELGDGVILPDATLFGLKKETILYKWCLFKMYLFLENM